MILLKPNFGVLIPAQNLWWPHFRLKVKELTKACETWLDLGSRYVSSGSLAYSLQMLFAVLDPRYSPASRTLRCQLFYLECSFLGIFPFKTPFQWAFPWPPYLKLQSPFPTPVQTLLISLCFVSSIALISVTYHITYFFHYLTLSTLLSRSHVWSNFFLSADSPEPRTVSAI